jgi:hypothetical protein
MKQHADYSSFFSKIYDIFGLVMGLRNVLEVYICKLLYLRPPLILKRGRLGKRDKTIFQGTSGTSVRRWKIEVLF